MRLDEGTEFGRPSIRQAHVAWIGGLEGLDRLLVPYVSGRACSPPATRGLDFELLVLEARCLPLKSTKLFSTFWVTWAICLKVNSPNPWSFKG